MTLCNPYYLPDPYSNHLSCINLFNSPSVIGIIIIPFAQLRKLRHRKVKQFVNGHTAGVGRPRMPRPLIPCKILPPASVVYTPKSPTSSWRQMLHNRREEIRVTPPLPRAFRGSLRPFMMQPLLSSPTLSPTTVPTSLGSSPTDLLSIPPTHQTYFCLSVFATVIPFS